jgi:hypothetical protein
MAGLATLVGRRRTVDEKQGIRVAGGTGVAGAASVRLAALGGAVYFAFVITYANLVSGSPAATDPAGEIFDYLARHHGRYQLAAVLIGLAMPAALLWLSGLFRALRRAEGGTPGLAVAALGGGVLAAAGTVTGALVLGSTATRITDLGPGGARVWWTMYLLSIGASLLGLLLVIGVTAFVSLQTKLFAGWFVVSSVVLALVSVIGAFTIGYDTSGIQVVAGVAIVLDSVWILLVSIFLWRDPALALP